MVYWSIGLNPGAGHFFQFLAFLFLALFAAETQYVQREPVTFHDMSTGV